MSMTKEFQINVFSSSNPAVVSVAKSLLDDAGVVYSMSTKDMGGDKKGKKVITEILVSEEQFQKAKSLLVELEELDFDVC
jgi:hypothetical protein